MTKALAVSVPPADTVQFKNGKAYRAFGKQITIADVNKREITIVDPAGKRYATMPAAQFGDAMASAMPAMTPEQKAAIAAMKGHSESKATGRTETILGVEGEEREIVISVDSPAMSNMPTGPMMRMVMHMWTAKASEAERVPAIGELVKYNLASIAGMDPVTTLSKAFEQLPGFGDTFSTIMKEVKSGGTPVVLRMQVEMFMPMLAAIMARMPAGRGGAGLDADAPLLKMTYGLAEISTSPVADSVFQVPEDYQAVPAADILKDLLKERMAQVPGVGK
jgi:hypothetical protein